MPGKARDKSPAPLRPLPCWPSKQELADATAHQVASLGMYINDNYNPTTEITAGNTADLLVQLTSFFQTDPAARDLQGQQDGLRPASIAAGTHPPSQTCRQLAASAAVAAPTASAAASQQPNLTALVAKASEWVQEARNFIGPYFITGKEFLADTILLILLVLVLFSCVQFLFQSTPQTYNVKNMTVSQRWAIVRQGRTNANFNIISVIVTMLKLAIMYTLGAMSSLSALVCVLPAYWHKQDLLVFWPWVEFCVLCKVAGWTDGYPKSCVLVFTKYWFNKGKVVNTRLLIELFLHWLYNFASSNKTVQTLMLPANMFLKSIVSSKETVMFLCTRPFQAPYDDETHPFHPDYEDEAGKKPHYGKTRVNELLGMLGQEAITSRSVTRADKEKLWLAHEQNLTRQSISWMLQLLIKLKQYCGCS